MLAFKFNELKTSKLVPDVLSIIKPAPKITAICVRPTAHTPNTLPKKSSIGLAIVIKVSIILLLFSSITELATIEPKVRVII